MEAERWTTKQVAPRDDRKPTGRPRRGQEIPLAKYREALAATNGHVCMAAEMLGVSPRAVSAACERDPALQHDLQKYRAIRIERAESVIDASLHDDDPAIRLRAAMFIANYEERRQARAQARYDRQAAAAKVTIAWPACMTGGQEDEQAKDQEGLDDTEEEEREVDLIGNRR